MRFDKVGLVLAWCLCTLGAAGQTTPTTSESRAFRPDLTIVARKHITGADLIEISVLDPSYPPAELQSRIIRLGTLLGDPPRGLSLFARSLSNKGPAEGNLKFLTATFAVTGLMRGQAGIRLEPLAQAFAGGEGAASVKAIEVILTGDKVWSNAVRTYRSKSVQVEAKASLSPPVLDYRIWLDSDDAQSIRIPDRLDSTPAVTPPPPKPKHEGLSPLFLWPLVALMAVAAAVLVYTLASRRRPSGGSRTPSKSDPVHPVS
jgi:hypothetical protein